jgi:hypothetical protein
MNAIAEAGQAQPVIRSEPDPVRPAMPAAEAARLSNRSRFHITEQVRLGKLAGYGVRRRDGGRVRWFVYRDVLPMDAEASQASSSLHMDTQVLLRCLLASRQHNREGRLQRGEAHRLVVDASDALVQAVEAALAGDSTQVMRLYAEAMRTRSDQERRIQRALVEEARAEAALDEALQSLLPLGDEG